MSKGATYANDLQKLIFQAVAIADLAADDQSSPATTLTVALHTASPGAGGNQSTNEIAYTGYARVAIARTAGGFAVGAGIVTPVATIAFGTMTAGVGGTVTHFSIGSGVGNYMICFGTVTPNIVVANNVTPELTPATSIAEV